MFIDYLSYNFSFKILFLVSFVMELIAILLPIIQDLIIIDSGFKLFLNL